MSHGNIPTNYNDEIEKWPTETQIHNQWVSVVNQALKRDCILTDSCVLDYLLDRKSWY